MEHSESIALDVNDTKIDNMSLEWAIMITIQKNLNERIGKCKWRKYITASIWNYVSTPINFTITLFTALSAGQTSAGTTYTYLTQNQLFYILFISFILSTINTFFKLKDKAILNYDSYKKYDKFGAEFESIYFTPISNNNDIKDRLGNYNILQQKLNDFVSEETIENVNYFSEVIFFIIKNIRIINLQQTKINERLWILDGETKINSYKKDNIEVDDERIFIFSHDEEEHGLQIKEVNKSKEVNNDKKDVLQMNEENHYTKIKEEHDIDLYENKNL
jgi:hypothetical protein